MGILTLARLVSSALSTYLSYSLGNRRPSVECFSRNFLECGPENIKSLCLYVFLSSCLFVTVTVGESCYWKREFLKKKILQIPNSCSIGMPKRVPTLQSYDDSERQTVYRPSKRDVNSDPKLLQFCLSRTLLEPIYASHQLCSTSSSNFSSGICQ